MLQLSFHISNIHKGTVHQAMLLILSSIENELNLRIDWVEQRRRDLKRSIEDIETEISYIIQLKVCYFLTTCIVGTRMLRLKNIHLCCCYCYWSTPTFTHCHSCSNKFVVAKTCTKFLPGGSRRAVWRTVTTHSYQQGMPRSS